MTDQQTGLRFDIYERIHLAEDAADILELEDVELIPQIQVMTAEDQAVLQGNLILTGSYIGDGNEGQRHLEHYIPVEISLPLNRIKRADDVLVEIENFDIDLLSSRSLNVTGILSLHGVEVLSHQEEEADVWPEEEELVFIHQNDNRQNPQGEKPEFAPLQEEPVTPERKTEAVNREPEEKAAPQQERIKEEEQSPVSSTGLSKNNSFLQKEVPQKEVPQKEVFLSAEPRPEESSEEFQREPTAISFDSVAESGEFAVQKEEEEKAEEPKELKVAFSGKQLDDAAGYVHSSGGQSNEREEDTNGGTQPDFEDEVPRADALEWKRLFVNSESEQPFRKVKMCIVQKEETLEDIAKKYDINLRELQLHNRLSDQEVSAGQILYIPK
ncbi:hypothetical protein B7C51_05745 [Paenibacillus larvae subsp. pulvifaciens]|uniref:LysM domain-containing protein n=2 Tax=Paenibacillus larvae TaxID=1464 RepID=A0A1V0UQL7_9BACL|nr:LysM peptidoglycan-binding domain-containing protein [Paenibacillus larvae]ARF67431.1 hypothetical protein B7C51_05745 [Paenibacillus larvae subsp. pulvifaciens]